VPVGELLLREVPLCVSDHCGDCAFDPRKRLGDDACPFTAGYWVWTRRHHELRGLADEHPAVSGEGDDRGRRAQAPGVGDNGRPPAFKDNDDRLSGSEVNADRTSHDASSVGTSTSKPESYESS